MTKILSYPFYFLLPPQIKILPLFAEIETNYMMNHLSDSLYLLKLSYLIAIEMRFHSKLK